MSSRSKRRSRCHRINRPPTNAGEARNSIQSHTKVFHDHPQSVNDRDVRRSCVSGEKGSRESGARASSPATTCLAVSGFLTGFPATQAHISMIYRIDMIVVSRSARKIWSAVARTALCAGRGTAFSPRHARKHWPHSCSKSVVRNTACRRTPNSFVTLAATPPPRKKPLRLYAKKTLNAQRSTFCGRGRPRSRLRTHKTRTRLAWPLSPTGYWPPTPLRAPRVFV